MIKRVSILFFVIINLVNVCFSQEAKLTATASKLKASLGDQIQINFSLNTNGSGFRGPAFTDFTVQMGPSTSYQTSIINGSYSQEITFSYIVVPNKEGTLTVGPASIVVGGKTIQSNSLKFEISKGATQGQNSGGTSSGNSENMFVKTIVNRTKCYQGEYVLVTHKVYARDQIVGFRDLDYPSYDGFWSQVLDEAKQNIKLEGEVINGVQYYVATLRQAILFPQRSGTMEIKPMSVEMVVRQRTKGNQDDFWNGFFGPSYKDASYKVKGNSAKIEVTPLPASGKPEEFSGSVGTFYLSAKTDKTKAKANTAINLTLTISGKGNLKMLEAPKVVMPDEIESYDPKSSENISVTAAGMSGSRTFEYVMIPRHSGDYKVSVQPFSYFDADKNTYITLPTQDFDLHIEKNGKEDENVSVSPTVKQEVKEIASDIRYIKTELKESKLKDDQFFRSAKFWTYLCGPGMLFFAFIFIRKKKEKEESDVVSYKSKKAGKLAQKKLSIANKHLLVGNKDLFYEEVLRAMNAYVSDRVNIPVADLSKEKIEETFKQKNIDPVITASLISILDKCEFAQYAPQGNQVEMGNMYNEAIEALIKIEENLS